ncbi:MAG: hypothetical protein SF187_17055 [Deltaproteobacteria bacterium]|nr:hypothetical protein [Deltaproteobacteria bacterium]
MDASTRWLVSLLSSDLSAAVSVIESWLENRRALQAGERPGRPGPRR